MYIMPIIMFLTPILAHGVMDIMKTNLTITSGGMFRHLISLRRVVFPHKKMLHLIHKLSSNLIVPHEVVPELFLFTFLILIKKNKMANLRDDVEMYS